MAQKLTAVPTLLHALSQTDLTGAVLSAFCRHQDRHAPMTHLESTQQGQNSNLSTGTGKAINAWASVSARLAHVKICPDGKMI